MIDVLQELVLRVLQIGVSWLLGPEIATGLGEAVSAWIGAALGVAFVVGTSLALGVAVAILALSCRWLEWRSSRPPSAAVDR